MGHVRTFLFYFAFWLLGHVIAIVIASIGHSALLFKSMMVYGAGDPQLMAGIISETIVTWHMQVVFITLFVYPLYALFRRKTRFLWLIVAIVFVLISAIFGMFSEKFEILNILINFVGIGIFCFIAAELPYRIRARKRARKFLDETKRTFD